MTKLTLAEFEDLVYRSTYLNEFLEEELQALLEPIFESPWQLTSQHYNEVKRLFFLIANMNKSTNFGYFFYENMQISPFPFCDEILKSAVHTEKYYNLHDKALKSYVRAYLIKNGVEPRDIIKYDTIIPEGHGTHFLSAFKMIQHNRVTLKKPIKPDLFNILYISVNNSQFPVTQKKTSCILAFLKLDCLLPALFGKATNLISKDAITTEDALVIIHFIQSIGMLLQNELPEEIANAINSIVDYEQRSEIVENFYALKPLFASYLNEHKSFALQIA